MPHISPSEIKIFAVNSDVIRVTALLVVINSRRWLLGELRETISHNMEIKCAIYWRFPSYEMVCWHQIVCWRELCFIFQVCTRMGHLHFICLAWSSDYTSIVRSLHIILFFLSSVAGQRGRQISNQGVNVGMWEYVVGHWGALCRAVCVCVCVHF